MRDLKIHLKLKGKAICGAKSSKRKLKFSKGHDDVTCGNCRRAIAT